MQTVEKGDNKARKSTGRKKLKIILAVAVSLLLVLMLTVLIIVPAFVSSEKMRQIILSKANSSMDGKLDFADLSMGWFSGIKVSNISFEDSAAGTSVAVKAISTKPYYASILFGSPAFGETVIDEPRVNIDASPKPETEKASQPATQEQSSSGAVGIPLSQIDLKVNDGSVRIRNGSKFVELAQINSAVNMRSPNKQSTFNLAATVTDGEKESPIKADGEITGSSKTGWKMAEISGSLSVEIDGLNLSTLEPILELAKVDLQTQGLISTNISSTIEKGKLDKLTGDVKGQNISLAGAVLKGDTFQSDTLTADIMMNRTGELMDISKFSVKADWFEARASGTAPMNIGSISEMASADSGYNLQGRFECDLPSAMAQMPNMIGLKEETKVTGGKLTGSVDTITETGVKKLDAQVSLEGLTAVVDGKDVSLSQPIRAQVKVGADGDNILFDKLGLSASFAKIECAGSTEQLNYIGTVDLTGLQNELGQFTDMGGYSLEGTLSSDGQVAIGENVTAVSGQALAKNIVVTSKDGVRVNEPVADMAFSLGIDKQQQILAVKNFQAKTGFGQVTVENGTVPLSKDSKVESSFTLRADGVDLAKLQPYAVMFGGIDKDLQMAGLAQTQVLLKVDKGIFRVTTDSTKVINFKLAASGKEPFIQDQIALVFDGWFDPAQKIWATEKIQVTSPQIKIAGDFADSKPGEQGNLKGNLQIEYDWSAVSKMLAAFMPDQLEILGKRSDRITVSSDYRRDVEGSLVQNLTTEANIGFEQAKYMGLDVGTTDVKMQMAKGALAIAPFSTTVNNGMLNFGGVVDMTQQSKLKPTEKMILFKTLGPVDIIKDVQLNDELANKLLARVNPIFKDAIGVTGVANFKCDKMLIALKGGADSDTDIEGTISLTQFNMQPTGIFGEILKATGASQGQKMTLHPTKFTVKNGYISYDNMQLDIGDNPIIFKGVLPLDPNEQIKEFSLTLPYTVAGRTVRTGGDTGERRITGYIKGTMKNPELDIEKIVQEELIQTGLDLLFKELNK